MSKTQKQQAGGRKILDIRCPKIRKWGRGMGILMLVSLVFSMVLVPAPIGAAAPVAFEVTIPWYELWQSTPFWGRGEYTASNAVAIRYKPTANQEVCTVKPGLYRFGSPTDNLKLTVKQGGPWPTSGTVVQTVTVGQDKIANVQPQPTPAYTTFSLAPCLSLTANTEYFFIFERSELNSGNGYITQFTQRGEYPQVRLWSLDPFNNGWTEYANRQPSLRLEGLDPATPTPLPSKTPVIIVPGIAGTELKNGDELIWPNLGQMLTDINDQFLTENLGLDEDGGSANSSITIGQTIEKILGNVPVLNVNIFEGLHSALLDKQYTDEQDLFLFPYDWRMDLNDTKSKLADKIAEVKVQTGAEKVNIVAHSMGGLLVKDYIYQYGKENINSLIFVGTPHLGAPKAAKIILQGDRLDIPWLEDDRVKEIGDHSVAVHELLPNQAYFDIAGPYLKKHFDNASGEVLTKTQTKELLLNNGSTESVYSQAESFFNQELENIDLSGLNVYNIAGCTIETQGGYEVRSDGSIAFVRYRAGDQTVPFVSADGITLPSTNKFYVQDGKHSELPSLEGVRDLIVDILDEKTPGSYQNVMSDSSTCHVSGQELIWRSPVEVHIYDSLGRHSGPIENNGFELGIPGVDYEVFGHEKFIFLPNNEEGFKVLAKGLDTGTFDLSVRQNDDGVVTRSTVFNDIPVTPSTSVRLETSSGQDLQGISIDVAGTETFASISATATIPGEQANDITSPEVAILSPTANVYKRSTILPFNIVVSDSQSGILSVASMLDGALWSSSSVDTFFLSLASHSISVFVNDRAGNGALVKRDFQIIATVNGLIGDIERAISLGWIKNSKLVQIYLKTAKLFLKVHPNYKLSSKTGVHLLSQLKSEYNKGVINLRAYNLLKEDLEWIMSK